MIPLRDENPSGTFPWMIIGIISANVLAFFYELGLGPELQPFLMVYGLVPVKVTYFGQIPGLELRDVVVPFFTSMFLHGGWFHLIGNMWFLWIFGDNIEDRLGHGRFLLFYLLCGIGASVAHIAFNPESGIPSIGASGAIAGVLGAYMISFPMARVVTLVPLFFFLEVLYLPAFLFLFYWFFIQLFNGTLAIALSAQTGGGVAWWAHIGGFITGVVLVLLFPKSRWSRQRRYIVWYDRRRGPWW